MVSEFRKKKILHLFNFFDANQSGAVDEKDFELAIEKLTKYKGSVVGDAQFKEVEETVRKIWKGLQNRADTDNDGQISKDEWIAMWDQYAKNPAAAAEWQSSYCKFVFLLIDTSGSDVLELEPFVKVCVSFGHDKAAAEEAFAKISKGKPEVTYADFQELWAEYLSVDDEEAPGNFIFGRRVA